MRFTSLVFVFAGAAVLGVSSDADAQGRGSCTDGQDCYCDRVKSSGDPLYDPNAIFCEDFEDPILNYSREPVNGDKGDSGWAQTYPGQVGGCFDRNHGGWNVEGPEDYKCVNVVQSGACDSPDANCVFDGNNSLGLKFRPGQTGGIVGTADFDSATRRIGYTYIYRYSKNFVRPSGPVKTNEFGDGNNCLLGCNTNNIDRWHPSDPSPPPSMSSWIPKAMSMGLPEANCPNGSCFGRLIRGVQGVSNSYHLAPRDGDYGESDHPIGAWGCQSFHIDGWGTADATIRSWHNGALLVHVEGADLTGLRHGTAPMASFVFNNYHNNGYPGSSVAYIYQDNIHITTGPEPISCDALGFAAGTSTDTSGSTGTDGTGDSTSLGAPGKPALVE